MIRLPGTLYVATQPTNLQQSFDRLAGLIRAQLKRDPRMDAAFLFHNKKRTHIKLIWHDSSGYRILFKRLDRGKGRFRIPLPIPADATHVQISSRTLRVLLEGVNMKTIRAASRAA